MVALPRLERLRMVTGETVGLHVPVGDSRMCVAELVSQAPIRAATGVGRMYDLPLGAAGKVLVAWSPGRLDMTVARLRPPDGGRRLRQEAAQVRRKGHAVSSGETIAGASAMSVPIYSSTGDVCAAVNVTGPANRWTRTSMAEHRASIEAEARAISALLGHDG
jgi:DNA-binding IclR family transcriptional regulator